MTERYPELDDEARRTAAAVEKAFAGLTYDRPSPATTPAQDDETAAALAAAFGPLVLAGPAPGGTQDDVRAPLVVLPRGRRRLVRRLGWPAAAAVAAVVTAVTVLTPSGSSTAWAAEPRTPTTADRAGIARACAAPVEHGLGPLEVSGEAGVPGAVPSDVPDPDDAPSVPDRLPPLAALDVRGDLAFAVYQDATWKVTCVVRATDEGWQDQTVQTGPGSGRTTPGVIGGGLTMFADGEGVTTLTGPVPAGTTRVTFRLDDGTQVEASVVGPTWAAWFPGDHKLDVTSLTAYDANGTPRPLRG